MKRFLPGLRAIVVLLLPLALLSGCATSYLLDNNVQSFSNLSAVPAGATYRFDRLPSPEPAPLLFGQRLELATVNDLDAGVVAIHAAIAQVDHDLLRRDADVL